MLPFGFRWRESLFIAWVGLRGAVPIILATVPVLRAEGQTELVAEALDAFDLVFFVVVVSAIVPGATVQHLARWLRLDGESTEESHLATTVEAEAPAAEEPVLAG